MYSYLFRIITLEFDIGPLIFPKSYAMEKQVFKAFFFLENRRFFLFDFFPIKEHPV